MVRVCALLAVILVTTSASPVLGRPLDRKPDYVMEAGGDEDTPVGRVVGGAASVGGAAPLASTSFYDTVLYGGTCWAADSLRWEAIRDSLWTFDSGVGSSFGPPIVNKPAGHHVLMEGWFGIDQTLNPLPYFRRSATCAISGGWSFWAGVTTAEANGLCYAAGQGYGNGWSLEIRKAFAYGGSGSVVLGYLYANDTEPDFDYSYALIDTTGTGAADDIVLATYDGPVSGSATLTLVPGATLRSTPGNVILKFLATSDGGYSDEDALYATTCGAFAVDNISLTGTITDFSDFETGPNGWAQVIPTTGVGDYSDIVDSRTDLPAPATGCRCGLTDSVLVFFDQNQSHPLDQDNIAASPWIDLKRNSDLGRPGKLILFAIYQDLPLANYVFWQVRARWYPSVCAATGQIIRSRWHDAYVIYPDMTTYCTVPDHPRIRDYSGVIETGAEQVQLGLGVLNLCRTDPWGTPCSGITNTTPWFDNVALGVFGHPTAPNISVLTFDFFQDAFAEDGTLEPGSTGRFDANTLKNTSTPGPGSILRDTLNARGDGGNTEVRLVFHVRPGPVTSAAALSAVAARWTPESSIGPNWYSARMDTAEQGGIKVIFTTWMTAYHELDPGFRGTDRTPDPLDPSQLENEILPDHVFTPGSRIDYFVQARYIPPDPRNVGGTSWYILPDTTGGRYFEVEILPSSFSADTTWNCTLYVDHHADRSLAQQALEEAGLTAALGLGGNNAEGTRYDRWDVQTPSAGQLSFGRPIQCNYGASITQAFGYQTIVWHSGNLSSIQLTDEDANILGPWLTLKGVGGNRFWGSGDGLARSMSTSGEPSTVNFMRSILGVRQGCNTIRDVNCPSGTPMDSTYCLPTMPIMSSEFFAPPASLRGNGCPDLLSFDLLGLEASVPTAKGQLNYLKSGGERPYASVTNNHMGDVAYRTVLDGFAIGVVRTTPADPHIQSWCSDTGASLARTAAILTWFGTGQTCRLRPGLVDVPGTESPQPPGFRTALGMAWPNPMTTTARIVYTNGREGVRITLQVFDVTGRLVRTLLDEPRPAGTFELSWDGTTASGRPAAGGLYFYRLVAEGGRFEQTRKLVVMR